MQQRARISAPSGVLERTLPPDFELETDSRDRQQTRLKQLINPTVRDPRGGGRRRAPARRNRSRLRDRRQKAILRLGPTVRRWATCEGVWLACASCAPA